MDNIQFLLTKLAEECNEVAQQALKSQQFGLEEIYQPIGKSNAERLFEELNDLWAIVNMLNAKTNLNFYPDEDMIQAKMKKVKKYYEYSRSLGNVSQQEL